MVLIFLVLFYIVIKLYRKDKITPSLFLILGYLLSSIIGLLYLINSSDQIYDYKFFSMVYYVVCLLVLLFPFIKFSGKSEIFLIPKKSADIVSYLLISLGLISLFFEIKDFNLSELMVNWLAARSEYYSDFTNLRVATSLSERISDNIKSLVFMCWPLAMYQFSIGKDKKLGILLIIVSCSYLISCLKIAERQGLIIYISNALFSYLIFKDNFTKTVRKKIITFSSVVIGLLVVLVGAITISRFGEGDSTIIESLATYSGVQPFNAAFFLEELHDQALGGRLNFPFLTGTPMILILNDEIFTDEYLNVFGSIIGSYYLDFGYFTVFIIIIVSTLFFKLMQFFKKTKSLLFLYIYSLYFNIMFVGIFYNKYTSPPDIRNIFLLGILIWGLERIYKSSQIKNGNQ